MQRLGRPEEEEEEDDDSDEEDDYDEEEPSGSAGLLSFLLSRPLPTHVLPLAQSAPLAYAALQSPRRKHSRLP